MAAIQVVSMFCLIAWSAASSLTHHQAYSPVYHQLYRSYVQTPTSYDAFPQIAPIVASIPTEHQVQYNPAPSTAKYDFSYGVHDSLTGDIKHQMESREGGLVQGSYSLIDSDGYKRTVTYTSDDVNGFNAIVQREPVAKLAAFVVPTIPQYPHQQHQYPQSQYLPVFQAPFPVTHPLQKPTIVEPNFDDVETVPAQQQPEIDSFQQSDNEDFQDSPPQSDDDSDVIEAYGAAASKAGNTDNTSQSNQSPSEEPAKATHEQQQRQ